MPKLQRRETIALVLAATLLLVWSSLPNWSGYLAQDAQHAYGGAYFDPQDYAVHTTMLRTGLRGAWAYSLRFTSESHSAAYVRMFYVVLGELDRLTGLSPEMIFEISRWVFGYTALFAIYLLARRAFDGEVQLRKWSAFFLIVAGAGLGWMQRSLGWVPGPITPIDYWLIDAYVLFSLSLFPHFALTLTLMCVAWLVYLDYLDLGGWLRILVVVLAAATTQMINPVAFMVVDVALLASTLLYALKTSSPPHTRWIGLAAVAVSQIPLLIYNVHILTGMPVWSQYTAQNQTPSPPPVYYLWGFGLFWPPALVGAQQAFRQRSMILLACVAWLATGFVLAYAPFPIQRRFLLGITIPLGLLATRGLADSLAFLSQRSGWLLRRTRALTLLAILLVSIGTLTFYPARTWYTLTKPPELFYPRSLDAAFSWISRKTEPDDLILATPRTSQLIAQNTGRRVFVGHEMETLDYTTKVREIESYYRGEMPHSWLVQNHIRWVMYGPFESQIAPDYQPGPDLEFALQGGDVFIYRSCRCSAH